MGREGTKRGHVLLAPDFGPPGPRFCPKKARSTGCGPCCTPAPIQLRHVRPSSLLVPALASARIQLVTRTSGSPAGVAHPADSSLGLERGGFLRPGQRGAICLVPAQRPAMRAARRAGMETGAGAVQLMTPREEVLAEQRIGPAGAALLYRLVRAVAISRNFPPPPGSPRWDDTAVTETAHDFLDGERGRRRVADIAIRSVDEITFERIMEAAVVESPARSQPPHGHGQARAASDRSPHR